MRDAQHTKERIRQAHDIADVVGRHVSLKRAGAGLKGLCPFHQEKTPSFTVNPARQIFKCFGCGAGGDIFAFVQRIENVGFREALELLAEQAGIALEPQRGRDPNEPNRQELLRVTQWAAGVFRGWLQDASVGQSARAYIARRGIADETAERFGLGYALDSFEGIERQADKASISRDLLLRSGLTKTGAHGGQYDTFRNRLVFPIIDPMDRVIGFGGRTLGDDPAKYLNSPESVLFDKGRTLYGLNLARRSIAEKGQVIVVEGYTDCLMAHQHGFTETVATMGTALTPAHVSLLKRYTDRIVLLFDSDEAGQRASERAVAATLTEQLDVRLAFVPEGKDPCDFLLARGAQGLTEVLETAVDALTYKWRQVMGRHAGASDRQRREALNEYLDLVATVSSSGAVDNVGRGMLAGRVAGVLSLPLPDVLAELHRRSSRQSPRPRENSSRAVARSGWSPPTDAEQAALCDLLEILCNEPGYYAGIESWFNPSSFSDPRLSRVARAVVDLIDSTQGCELAALLSRFDDPADAELIVELHSRGENKGNFAQRIEGAVANLQRTAARRRAEQTAWQATQSARGGPAHGGPARGERTESADGKDRPRRAEQAEDDETADTVDEKLLALQARARQSSGFAPRTMVRTLSVTETASGSAQAEGEDVNVER